MPLTWGDLQSRCVPGREEVVEVVTRVLLHCPPQANTLAEIEHVLAHALVERLGLWVAGWNWAASEPGGGGPVGVVRTTASEELVNPKTVRRSRGS